MLNRFNRHLGSPTEAKLRFDDADYKVLRNGSFVRCAVTGDPIQLDDLRYWSVELQEPYKSAEISLQRYLEIKGK